MRQLIKPFYLFVILVLSGLLHNTVYAQARGTATFTGRLLASCEIVDAVNGINIPLDTVNISEVNGSATRARKSFQVVFRNCSLPFGSTRVTLQALTVANGVLSNNANGTQARNTGIVLIKDGTTFNNYNSVFNVLTDANGLATLSMAADYGLTNQGAPTAGDVRSVVTITASPQ